VTLKLPHEIYGEGVPYGDPAWYAGFATPYYNDSHRRFRTALREVRPSGGSAPLVCGIAILVG